MRILVARGQKAVLPVIRLPFAFLKHLGSWIDSEGLHNPTVPITLVSAARIVVAMLGEKE